VTRRVTAVDCGTNSLRLLLADVDPARAGLTDVVRRMEIVRLGQGVDQTGRLAPEALARTMAVLREYADVIARSGAQAVRMVATSATRDADNAAEFVRLVKEVLGVAPEVLTGDEEAVLSFTGATAELADGPDPGPFLVADIGGGSTELVIGEGGEVRFHVSTQIGVVRHSERHLRADPPAAAELAALEREVARELGDAVPAGERERVTAAVAVAGTATQSAGIDLGAEGRDVEGHVLPGERLRAILARIAAVPLEERREVPGLDPDRAPTIVAGVVVLIAALEAFGLEEVEVSERDILWGAALETGRDATSN
jgi:exopolyphosphatase / guanosine-5'-triphosphate,3'-diphosphate pyrophosphatase